MGNKNGSVGKMRREDGARDSGQEKNRMQTDVCLAKVVETRCIGSSGEGWREAGGFLIKRMRDMTLSGQCILRACTVVYKTNLS